MLRLISLLSIAFLLITCQVSAQEKSKKINYKKEGYVKAVIINYNVENCGFLIELCDKAKTKLAGKLNDEFKKDKQKIWIKYSFQKKQPISTCMAGKTIEITNIKKR
ncbi:MAG: hypothetical protein ABI388_01145 [Bacteroidia bacterium]